MRGAFGPRRVDPRKNLVGFLVGGVEYAIDIPLVSQIVNPLPITPLPHVAAPIAGVADHRGEVIPVVDLRLQFGVPVEVTRRTKWLIVRVREHQRAGVVVDAVTGVFGTAQPEMRAVPRLGAGEERRGIASVADHDGAMAFVIRPELVGELVGPVLDGRLLAGEARAPGRSEKVR
jgi:purine-binding chemotaxis protein CheW